MLRLRDLDHLAARLHGRRARLYDGARLRALCGLDSPAALARTLFPGEEPERAAEFQARLAEKLIFEILEISACLEKAGARFAEWQAAVFRLENLKTAVRGIDSGAAPSETRRLLALLPEGYGEGYGPELAEAGTPEALLAALPDGFFRRSLAAAYAAFPGEGRLFFLEAALDRDYLEEMSARAAALNGQDRDLAAGLCSHEAAAFNLMLAARGKLFYGLEEKKLLELYIPGAGPGLEKFLKMLRVPEAGGLRALAAGSALEPGPPEPDPSALEALARRRYFRLANRALRAGHMGFGAVAAYLALRRVETSNLITVAEGLRLKVGARDLFGRLIPRAEASHV